MNIFDWLKSLFSQPVPHNAFPDKNQGVLEGVKPEDWIAGAIPFEVRNKTSDWRGFLPSVNEQQNSRFADAMACVSFSLTNSLEIQARQLSGQNFNWSDRFLAKMSNTTRQGNWLNVVADTARKFGLVSEQTWPAPADFTWDSYYSEIPSDVQAKGKVEFPFAIAYEWIPSDKNSLLYHLQHAPIQITIPGQNPNHAVVLVAIVGDLFYYYDSYSPHLKTMSSPPASALKIVLYDNRIVMRQIGWNDAQKGVYVGFDTMDRQKRFFDSMAQLFPDYRLEQKEWNLGKRPWSG